jgi:hypothetical protein
VDQLYGVKVNSVVQDNAQEGIVDVDLAVAVSDEAQFPEFVSFESECPEEWERRS